MTKEDRPILALFNLVMEYSGSIKLAKTLYPETWPIKLIRGVSFTEEFETSEEDDNYEWNAYVDRIRRAIGVKSYCQWIRGTDGNIVGILAFYTSTGEEIKMKSFDKWNELFNQVKNLL